MKKILSLALAITMGFSLTACAGNPAAGSDAAGIDFNEPLSGEITVYTYDSMLTGPFLEESALLFMDKHPGTKVTVESFSAMPEVRRSEGADGTSFMVATRGDDSQERRDYINMVNTELMSGRGPDVLATDILPFHAYAANGQLLNLRAFMDSDPDFDINDYRVNIFDAVAVENGQFMFPVDYSFRYAAYDGSLFTDAQRLPLAADDIFSFGQLIEIGREPFAAAVGGGEPILLLGMDAGELFHAMLAQNYSQFVDIDNRAANFTDGAFEALLNASLAYEREGFLRPRGAMAAVGGGGRMRTAGSGSPDGSVAITPDMIEQMRAQRFFFKPRMSMMLLNEFNRGGNFQMMAIGGGMMSNMDNDEVAGLLGNEQGDIPFTVNLGLGINANSENRRLAWEFIKFVSDEGARVSMRMAGLTTHIGAFEERAAMSIIGSLFDPSRAGEEMDADQQAVFDGYTAAAEAFTARLNTFTATETMIDDIIRTETAEFFDGSRSAQDVAGSLQSRVTLYLNE